jgi:hypothetical protein
MTNRTLTFFPGRVPFAAAAAVVGCSASQDPAPGVVRYPTREARPACDGSRYLEVALAVAERVFAVCVDGT